MLQSPRLCGLSAAPRRLLSRWAIVLVGAAIGMVASGTMQGVVAQTTLMQDAVPAAVTPRGGVFTVGGIDVDATSADAVAARAQAIREGQQAGLDRLLRRLVLVEDYPRLPRAANLPIDDYVQSFEIADEELSSTRYIAQLTVAYDPDAVRSLLSDQGFAFAQSMSMPLVVLPLYETADGGRLWQEDNPWWEAWALHLDPEQLLRLVLPLGDLEDFSKVSVDQARSGDPLALADLAARYGAEDVLVVTARPVGGPAVEQVSALQLDARRIGPGSDQQGVRQTLAVGPAQPLDTALALAVEETQASLDQRWKSANLLRFDQGGRMLVDVPIARLADWVAVNAELTSLPEVSEIVMMSFSQDRVGLEMHYIGDERGLEQALARLGLALTREGESWLLLPMAASPDLDGQQSATSTAS